MARLGFLRRKFLPYRFSPTATYSADQLDDARAYRLLAHAEIEFYFEQRVIEIAQLAFTKWRNRGHVCTVLLHIVCNISGDQSGLPKRLATNITANSIVQTSLGQFRHSISGNHGIRVQNILQLLLPVGIAEADIDPAWLATIDGFGVTRGLAAHSSAVTYTIDPRSDYDSIQAIIAGIRDIDALLNRLRRDAS